MLHNGVIKALNYATTSVWISGSASFISANIYGNLDQLSPPKITEAYAITAMVSTGCPWYESCASSSIYWQLGN
jgi:hypothetical protein